MKEDNKLAFNVMVIRNTDDTIITIVYQKPTDSDIYVNWHTHIP